MWPCHGAGPLPSVPPRPLSVPHYSPTAGRRVPGLGPDAALGSRQLWLPPTQRALVSALLTGPEKQALLPLPHSQLCSLPVVPGEFPPCSPEPQTLRARNELLCPPWLPRAGCVD